MVESEESNDNVDFEQTNAKKILIAGAHCITADTSFAPISDWQEEKTVKQTFLTV